MVKLSVNETKWSSLLARTLALILYISILIFDFGPEKLPGLSRNGAAQLPSSNTKRHYCFSLFTTEKDELLWQSHRCNVAHMRSQPVSSI